MKEIDEMLDRWIYNTIIRKQLRNLIIKYIKEIAVEFYKSQVRGSTYWDEGKRTFEANILYEDFKLKQ